MKVINEEKREEEKYNTTTRIIIFSVVIVLIIMTFITINTNIKEKNKNMRPEQEQQLEEERQTKLSECISTAKRNRTDLWNNNCTKQSDGSCTIQNKTGTIEWIEQRYEQDIKNCHELYGK